MNKPRRNLLKFAGVTGGLEAIQHLLGGTPAYAKQPYEVSHSDAEWRTLLNAPQYKVLRKADTEHPFSSPLEREKRVGEFACAGCALPLFSSETKFDSGTGWPSFWRPLENAIETHSDSTFGMTRVEVRCRRCGGHLGHVFKDGPPPTGLRYCINGIAMVFKPKS